MDNGQTWSFYVIRLKYRHFVVKLVAVGVYVYFIDPSSKSVRSNLLIHLLNLAVINLK